MKTFILCILMFCRRILYHLYRVQHHSVKSQCDGNGDGTLLYLLQPQCATNDFGYLLTITKVVITNSTVIKVLANMTQCGFGIYMVHYFVVGPFFLLIGPSSLPIPLQVPLMAICIFLCSWAFTALIYKLMPRKAVWFMG